MKKVLISDSVDSECITILENNGFKVDYLTKLSEHELADRIPDYNVLIVRSATNVTKALIDKMNSMEIIGRAGTGIDNIDFKAASRKGILVMNTPGGNTLSAAEHTMALILSVCRHIPQANNSLKSGSWERKKFQGTELSGKTLGLIGLGKIGKEVATRSKSFGMKVITYDPLLSKESAIEIGVELVSLDSVFSESDIISVHTPLNDKTKHLLGNENFDKCKKGVKIINCARGGIINEEDLVKAIDDGIVSGAGIDVFENEPPDFKSELINHPAVVTTPHLGASTDEAQKKVAIQIAQQVIDYYKSGSLVGAVNAYGLKDGILEEIEPYVVLAEIIGRINGQILKSQLKKINIVCIGELLHKHADLLVNSLLKGLLSEKLDQTINLINSRILAQEMGIVHNITRSGETSDFNNLLVIDVNSENEKREIAGTVYGNNEIRIVKIDNYIVELKPAGNLLIYNNPDKPGMLASVSKILAANSINIAGLSLGRFKQGEDALTVISTDDKINKKVFSEISSIDGIKDIYTVTI
jgi:D-3-phosphoglycerate dehydrogenase / 2-oxoglutarate reductase